MIVEFSVKNFRSIEELQTISFVSTNLKSSSENSRVDKNNIVNVADQKLLKTIGIYGANASGKSNLIKAFEYFCDAILELPSPESRLSRLAQPFLYQKDFDKTESYFQIVVLIGEKKYRYGFTVMKNHNNNEKDSFSKEIITNEWLFGVKNKNQGTFFTRKDLAINKTGLEDIDSVAPLKYRHTLFLTHSASFQRNICAKLRDFISGYIVNPFGKAGGIYRLHSIEYIEDPYKKIKFLSLFKSFGLDYKDFYLDLDEEDRTKSKVPLEKVFLLKSNSFDDDNDVKLNMQKHESDGTKKLFDLAGLLLLAFYGPATGLIIIDEIDSNFHPSLLIKLIEMFNDPTVNETNSQLLFTSHDTNLMSPKLMRRDQFYFAEKDEKQSTRFYSLSELKGIRNDADFAKHYLAGFYGGLPMLSAFKVKK
jgi:AAA15 family ATPase/GTPase